MSKLLVKFQADYADEFDVYGFAVMTEEEWRLDLEVAEKRFASGEEVERYFGTNEQITWSNFEEYKESFDVTHIDDVTATLLNRLFGETSYGHFLTIDD